MMGEDSALARMLKAQQLDHAMEISFLPAAHWGLNWSWAALLTAIGMASPWVAYSRLAVQTREIPKGFQSVF